MLLTTGVNLEEPLGCSLQDLRLHETLPWREARCLEGGTAQPERYSLYASDSTAIRADSSVELAIAKLQLEWKLAEIAEHSIISKRLPVASMPQQMGLDERLCGLVRVSKELF